MRITDIRMDLPLTGRVLAFVTVIFDEQMAVHGIKIVKKPTGELILAMPTMERNDRTYKDIVHPIDKGFRAYMTKLIFDQYDVKSRERETNG